MQIIPFRSSNKGIYKDLSSQRTSVESFIQKTALWINPTDGLTVSKSTKRIRGSCLKLTSIKSLLRFLFPSFRTVLIVEF